MGNFNAKDLEYIKLIKARIDQGKGLLEKENIIKEVVKELKSRGFSDEEIIKLFSIESLFEQTNTTMIDNNARYLALLKKVLGGSK